MFNNKYITTSELRVGNWIKYNDKTRIGYEEIGEQLYFVTAKDIAKGLFENFTGIEIDLEFLKSHCPNLDSSQFELFSKHIMLQNYLRSAVVINDDNSVTLTIGHFIRDPWGYWSATDALETPLSNVRYLHQLQNLYFSVTGKELTLKIES